MTGLQVVVFSTGLSVLFQGVSSGERNTNVVFIATEPALPSPVQNLVAAASVGVVLDVRPDAVPP